MGGMLLSHHGGDDGLISGIIVAVAGAANWDQRKPHIDERIRKILQTLSTFSRTCRGTWLTDVRNCAKLFVASRLALERFQTRMVYGNP